MIKTIYPPYAWLAAACAMMNTGGVISDKQWRENERTKGEGGEREREISFIDWYQLMNGYADLPTMVIRRRQQLVRQRLTRLTISSG